ncbi:Phosphoinositide phospholipase C, Ca2+-dependent [Pricia antarctica]|uniref:Phosphoinositide phospholipase C, Ca2+-dependent n=1 Tax=Pricia antarctica TaxID=641691 RepID=A0A1G6WTP3_9FLAO|nr:phosphatidylinositol-specific phospholipase C1-like protein [Pricia antarctica]SDD69194.1 Phosphoinositide phospholipase C, Ca2+-dependent [Pricia antarctica]
MKTLYTIFSLIAFIQFFNNSAYKNSLEDIKINDIQIIGSHNSYKVAIERPILDYLFQLDSATGRSLQYEHPPFTEQLELGLRNLELDVFNDPKGSYYSNPAGLDIVKASGNIPLPFDQANKLKVPGLKVFHVQEIDFRSNQLLFKDALTELKKWSDKNPGHTPIIVTINAKDGEIPNTLKPLIFDAEALQTIDAEIRSIFSEEKLITPDLVRGSSTTLEEAVLKDGWPKLKDVNGKFLFVLDEGDAKLDLYLQRFPSLKGAVLFVNKAEGNPEAAFRIVNDPIADFDKIKELVALGYMVRTRADADTKEARANNYSKFEKAKESGAQIITTDYYVPSKLFESDYQVIFDDGTYERIKKRP